MVYHTIIVLFEPEVPVRRVSTHYDLQVQVSPYCNKVVNDIVCTILLENIQKYIENIQIYIENIQKYIEKHIKIHQKTYENTSKNVRKYIKNVRKSEKRTEIKKNFHNVPL